MQRERLPEDEALRFLKGIDEARRRWGLHLYGVDTNDPGLHGLVIHIKKLSTDDAADLICHGVASDRSRATAESQQVLEDLLLAARVRAALIEDHPRSNVIASEGVVHVGLEGAGSREEKAIQEAAEKVPGVERIDLNAYPFVTAD